MSEAKKRGRPKGSASTSVVKDPELEIDKLITKRSGQDHADENAELESVQLRRRAEKEKEQNKVLWAEHHRKMARQHHDLAAYHAAKVEELGGEAM